MSIINPAKVFRESYLFKLLHPTCIFFAYFITFTIQSLKFAQS